MWTIPIARRASSLEMARARRSWVRLTLTMEFWPRGSNPTAGLKGGFTAETIARGDHFFKMRGNEVFKVAVRSMTEISRSVLCEAGLKTEDIDLFIPHQANQRITDAVSNALNVDQSKVFSNIAQHGNTSSASIPIALDECVDAERVKKDDIVLLSSFGGGFTW